MRTSLWILAGMMVTSGGNADELRVLRRDDALQMALESDERIEIQRREVDIAGREVSRAWTIISPRLTASGRYERPNEEIRRVEQVVVPEDSWQATLTATQPLFDARVLSARRAGLALEASEALELVHTIRTSLFEVSRSYYEVLQAQKQVEISEQTHQLTGEEVARAKARYDAGEARRTEVLRAEVDEAASFRNLVAAQNAYAVAKSDLARRIGLPAEYEFEVEDAEPALDREDEPLQDLYRQAMAEREDLKAARQRIDAAQEQSTVLRRQAWPTLDLEYNHLYIDPESFTRQSDSWTVSAVVRYEFWDGGARRVSRLQQDQRVSQEQLRVQDLERAIRLEVQQALLEVQTLRRNLATLRKEVDLAEENYRTLSKQARVGLSTSLDVSTALNALDQARTELSRQQYDFELAKQRLESVTGTFANEYIQIQK